MSTVTLTRTELSGISGWFTSTLARHRWVGPAAVLLVAAALRLWGLGSPHQLIFDETYYVKDADSLLHLGYEGVWPYNANSSFNTGHPMMMTFAAEPVAHPPLGKWLIGLGMLVLGAGNPFGWRIAVAVAGILTVGLVMLIANRLFRSMTLTVVAGALIACDGMAIVMSRVGMLDGFLTLFALTGFYFVLRDRDTVQTRLTAAAPGRLGPVLWARPWLVAAGATLGLATGIKWSGAYFLAFFAVYVVLTDLVARRRAGVQRPWSSTAVQAPITFLLMIPVAAVAYTATWTGWLVTDGGYFRHWAETNGTGWGGMLSWVPDWFQNLWHYQVDMYQFNTALTMPHPFHANPYTWLLMLNPTPLLYAHTFRGEQGCGFDECVRGVDALANPVIWWAAVAATIYLTVTLLRRRSTWQAAVILTGVAAGYLPWLLYPNRTVFQYYTVAFEPYLILALTLTIGQLLTSDNRRRRRAHKQLLTVLATIAGVITIVYYPLWSGQQAPAILWYLHAWVPSWRGPF